MVAVTRCVSRPRAYSCVSAMVSHVQRRASLAGAPPPTPSVVTPPSSPGNVDAIRTAAPGSAT